MQVLHFLLLFGLTVAFEQFMDCPGNKQWWNIYRRCCTSSQLPKGCECFDISKQSDFRNSLLHVPRCPDKQAVLFTVYSSTNPNQGTQIQAGSTIASSPVDASKLIKFIVHGFDDTAMTGWVLTMKNELLAEADINVITVDWTEGAKPPNYYQGTANTRVVGAMLGRLIQDLKIYKYVSLGSVHLIGHSLGAQISGYAGKEIYRLTGSKIGRITGLDPAGPNFESYSENVRIDKNDAMFVDIIHTDAESLSEGGFGTRISTGHADFYPNGGKHQPNCDDEIHGLLTVITVKGGLLRTICSHNMAYTFFTNSIRACRYDPPTGGSQCTMGYHVSSSCRGDYFPTTTETAPFC